MTTTWPLDLFQNLHIRSWNFSSTRHFKRYFVLIQEDVLEEKMRRKFLFDISRQILTRKAYKLHDKLKFGCFFNKIFFVKIGWHKNVHFLWVNKFLPFPFLTASLSIWQNIPRKMSKTQRAFPILKIFARFI